MAYDLRHRAVALLYSEFVACEREVRAKDWVLFPSVPANL
jgi:hypothetical protein